MDNSRKVAYVFAALRPKLFSLDACEAIASNVDRIGKAVVDRMNTLAGKGCLQRSHVVKAIQESERGEL